MRLSPAAIPVTEFNEADAVNSLAAWAKKAKFGVRQMTLELRGRCKGLRENCSA